METGIDEVPSIFAPGVITLITGRMGSGKTDFALLLAEIAMKRRGHTILTNIIMEREVEGVVQVTRASELLRQLAEEKTYVTILDEAGLFANSKQIKNKANISLVKLILVIRKLGSSVIFVNQRDMETVKTIRYLSVIEFHKESHKIARVLSDYTYGSLLHNIPRTSLPFDTRAIAFFKIDIDIEKLFADLSNMTYKLAMKKLREIAKNDFEEYGKEEQGNGPVEKKPTKIAILRSIAEAHPDWGTTKLAKIVGVSDRYVRSLRGAGKI